MRKRAEQHSARQRPSRPYRSVCCRCDNALFCYYSVSKRRPNGPPHTPFLFVFLFQHAQASRAAAARAANEGWAVPVVHASSLAILRSFAYSPSWNAAQTDVNTCCVCPFDFQHARASRAAATRAAHDDFEAVSVTFASFPMSRPGLTRGTLPPLTHTFCVFIFRSQHARTSRAAAARAADKGLRGNTGRVHLLC